ncbi:hypothetical protein B6K86_05970 [Lachnospiraceae bacterium]|nr:hypothetical protein B6K86_05970 [Lachnospiraceae bacterium]
MLLVLLLAVGFLPLLPAVTVRAATTYQANSEASLKQAEKSSAAGDTVELSGEFALSSAVSIKQGVTLCVTGNTVLTGNKTDGLILEEGARLLCSDQASLSMKGFQTALMIEKGAEVGDGTYVLDGNECGFDLKGSFRGSSREKLQVSAVSENGRAFTYTSDSLFCRCTVRVVAKNGGSEQSAHLNLKDASLTTKGVWYTFNLDPADTPVLSMDHAEFYAYKATGYRQTMTIAGRVRIVNGSRLTSDGSRISVGTKDPVEVEDSELVLKNSSDGGLNIDYKNSAVVLKNSTITGKNLRYSPLFGTAFREGPASIRFLGDCVVNTPAGDKNADNGGADRSNQGSYIVTGGSYLVAYDPGYRYEVTTPTNGPEHGDEWLSLFTLSDSSQTLLHPIDKNGMPYDYSVKKATRDGKKHVWTPRARVFYQLSNGNAVFPDGTTKDKTASTIRGYRLQDVEGNVSPGTPKDKNGRTFLGWYYRDETGEEHAFDETLPLTDRKDRIVYAKWDINMVVYHQNVGRLSYTESIDPTVTDAPALSMEAVEQQAVGFLPPGKRFRYWTENPDGTGERILPGKTLHFNPSKKRYDLYAQYQVLTYTVAFSANGGRFSDASVYKTHPEVFEILEDPNGGEVARLKKPAEYGTKLRTLLGDLDYNLLKPDAQAEKPGFLLKDATYWKTDPEGTGSIRFDDYKIAIFTINGSNPAITADTTYYLSWKMDDTIDTIEQSFSLEGDVYGKSSAESKKTQVVKATEAGKGFRLTCGLNVASIKGYMDALPGMLGLPDSTNYESIRLFGTQSKFTAVLKLPEGVVVPDEKRLKVTAKGLGDCFEKTRSTLSGKTLTIVFDLKDGMTNFQRLHEAVFSTGWEGIGQGTAASDDILVTVEGLSLDSEKVTNGQKLKIIGTLKGSFSAVAVKDGQQKGFVFDWTGKQSASGRDENSDPGSDEITYTLQVLKPMDAFLPADILSDGETEHDAIYPVLPGTILPFTGALKVSSIREQMRAIEDIYPDHAAHPEQLKIQVRSCTFTAEFTLPDGLEYPEDVEHKVTPENFGKGGEFTISETRREGQKLTVRMKLKDGIQNYKQLQDAVAAAGKEGDEENDWMRLTVKGVRVKPGAAAGTKFTVTGTISGEMDATATAPSGKEREFSFAWHGEQWDPGRDFVLEGDPSASRQAIQFTVEVRGKTGVLNLKKIVAGETKKQSEERFAIRIWADSPLTGAYPALAESEQTGGGAAVRRKVEFVPAEHEKRGEDGTDYVSYAEVELKAGEAISIGGLPDGLGYFVEEEITEEQAQQGYVKEYKVFPQEGRIAGEQAAFVLIVNYRQHQGQEVLIKKQWKNDEEQMRPKCLHFRLVPHRGSADGEVFPSIPQEEITMYPEQGFWYASRIVPMLASMSNAETRSNASNSVAEAVKKEAKRHSHSNTAVGSNADAGKRTPSEADLLDKNGNLADGPIFNDILNGVGAFLRNTWNEWSEKLFQQEAVIWTLEETDVPDGYTPEIGEGTWENGTLHFVVTNRYQKDQPNVTPEPEPNVTPGHGGHGHGKGGGGGFVIRRTPAPSEPPVPSEPSVQDHVTEHPSGYEAVSEGPSSSGALPKTGEALQMTGMWSLSGLVLLLYALFLKLRRR